jgi:hypothetical protein
MPESPKFPSIPVPTADPNSLLECVLVIKQTLETLTGADGQEKFASHVFMDHEPPEAIHKGDIWLYEGERFSLNIWNGERWILIVDVVPPTALLENPDFLLSMFKRPHR